MLRISPYRSRYRNTCHVTFTSRLWSSGRLDQSSFTVAQLIETRATDPSLAGRTITVNGFVRSVRKQKQIAFAVLGDGSSLHGLQAVLTPEQAKDLSTGIAVRVAGRWQTSPSGKQQSHELAVEHLDVVGEHDVEAYPIQKQSLSSEFLRTVPHLRTRIPRNGMLLRLRSEAIRHASAFFTENDYVQTHPPITTSSDCEGAGEVFTLSEASNSTAAKGGSGDFFTTPKYLTVSTQLHLEALAQSVGKVWTLSPTFRAEHSDTPRHLAEFYMLEAEACFVADVNTVMNHVEGLLRAMVGGLKSSIISQEILEAQAKKRINRSGSSVTEDLEARWDSLIGPSWPRISYTQSISLLRDAVAQRKITFHHEPRMGSDLQPEHERYLAETVGRRGPVFVTDYPRDIKAFYMAPSSVTLQHSIIPTVACFDLLVPEVCEIVGGSIREHRLGPLLQSMQRKGFLGKELQHRHGLGTQDLANAVPASMQWYLDLRRFGSAPHGGFGLGFDRLLCYLSGVSNVREMVTFPRYYGRCDC